MPDLNADQIAYWNTRAGDSWVAMQEKLDRQFAPLTAILLEAAAPRPGEHVLDIGCGCGDTTLQLARLVAPSGLVTGADISHPMTTRAKARIAEAGIANASVIVADASTADLPPADLLFSRFGVMFFADPVAAFANLRKAMKPGGRMLCAAWRPMPESAWFSVALAAARTVLPPLPPADPLAPGPFAFADPARVTGILSLAGWTDPVMTPRDVKLAVAGPGEVAEAADFAMRIGPVARMLAEADPALAPAVREAIAEAFAPYDGPGGVQLGGAIWLMSARA
jgi:SAM-dependent methyltransferase